MSCENRFDLSHESFGQLFAFEFDAVTKRCISSESLVYFCLVSMRNAQSLRTPLCGMALIARKTNQSKRTCQRAIRSLIDAGLIIQERHGQRSCYAFPLLENATQMTRFRATDDVQNIEITERRKPESFRP